MRGFIEKPKGSGKLYLRIRLDARSRYFPVMTYTETKLLQNTVAKEERGMVWPENFAKTEES
jgi:hypothetical protein